jgi:DNA-binding NarL/FixJ family response regulator
MVPEFWRHCAPTRRPFRFPLGADDYLTKPAGADDVLAAIQARLDRHREKEQAAMSKVDLKPNFESAQPLEALGLTPREAEVLLWVAQGKANADIATILGCAENTIKVHLGRVFDKLGFENRHAATVRALEVLSSPGNRHWGQSR